MPTEEQLTRALKDAFRTSTSDLTYDRPAPVPRRTGMIAGPLLLTGVVGAAVVVSIHSGSKPVPPQALTPVTTSAPSTTGTSSMIAPDSPVTRTLSLAGYSITYTQSADSAPFVARYEDAVPGDAKPVTVGAQSIPMGIDPATGTESAWLSVGGNRYIVITSADATQNDLVALIGTTPRPIPAVR